MEEGTLAKWLVKEGDMVKSGQIIAEIETDKATMEFEAVDEGIVGRILVAEGTAGVKVNTPIAVLVEDGESADAAPKAAAAPCPGGGGGGGCGGAGGRAGRAPVAVASKASPDWPQGTAMKTMTVREALREAMAEEMRANPRLSDGRGSRRISGRLQDQPGPSGRIRAKARCRHSDHRDRLYRHRRWRRLGRASPDRRVHDLQLRHAGD